MENIINMFSNLNVAVIATDSHYKVIYQNEKCRRLFKQAFGTGDYIGKSIHECHKAETKEIIETIYQEYQEKTRNLYHYVRDGQNGKITVVNSPFYNDDGAFAGVVEFIFESSLA